MSRATAPTAPPSLAGPAFLDNNNVAETGTFKQGDEPLCGSPHGLDLHRDADAQLLGQLLRSADGRRFGPVRRDDVLRPVARGHREAALLERAHGAEAVDNQIHRGRFGLHCVVHGLTISPWLGESTGYRSNHVERCTARYGSYPDKHATFTGAAMSV